MYREQPTHSRLYRMRWAIAFAAVLVLLVAALAFGSAVAGAQAREQGAASVRQAILDTALQCCAVEGSYPLTLSYLEDHYGLRVNRDDYVITYEAFAGNVVPSVAVVPR